MAISMKKYVDIKSAINTTKTATEKELIARIFTQNGNCKPNIVYEFENIGDVSQFFADESEEHKIAQKYFGFINKYARSPKKISFYRDWKEGIFASISSSPLDLDTIKAVTDGEFIMSIGDNEKTIASLDFSSATDFDDVASILQTAIRAVAGEGEDEYANATVEITTFDNNYFLRIISGTLADVWIDIEENSTTEALSLSNNSDYKEQGRGSGTLSDVFEESYKVSNNFATFKFIDDTITADDYASFTEDLKLQHPSEFMTVISVDYGNRDEFAEKLANKDGVSLELVGNYNDDDTKYNYIMPMAITATTDYNKENGTVNYMYTQYNGMNVVVDNDIEAELNDKLKINYYGRTQQAGQKLAFYQNGVLQGNYQDQNIYVNEIWLKDALTTKYINYMMLTSNWYANKSGQAIGQGLAMDVITRAKLNGTITTEKEISEADKVYIYNITANEDAWRQIYQEGYYLATNIEKKTINNQETYVFNYLLLYSKGDSIKKVEGLDILI